MNRKRLMFQTIQKSLKFTGGRPERGDNHINLHTCPSLKSYACGCEICGRLLPHKPFVSVQPDFSMGISTIEKKCQKFLEASGGLCLVSLHRFDKQAECPPGERISQRTF
jgi:hypothetical protein